MLWAGVTKRETKDKDGKVTGTIETVYEDRSDGTSVATTMLKEVPGDDLRDIMIVTKDAMGVTTDDIVVHPGVQDHAIVSDPQYEMIRTGMAARPSAKTVMGQAVLHLNYKNDNAFVPLLATALPGGATTVNLELEAFTESPACAASGCTYSDFRAQVGPLLPNANTEVRIYAYDSDADFSDGAQVAGHAVFDATARPTSGYAHPQSGFSNLNSPYFEILGYGRPPTPQNRHSESVLIRTLADLLRIGGAGAEVTYTEPSDAYVDEGASAADVTPVVSGPKFVVERADATALERGTFTHLLTAGLADGVLGIGQQVKEVNSYMRLGGTREGTPNPVEVKVENYFGWMEHSMFTVHRVTAQGVKGDAYNWGAKHSALTDEPGATDEARAYFGMASGTPSNRPEERRIEGMTDPGIWTGEMIGVGSIQGERYRGDANVTVKFEDNSVTTAFNNIRLAPNNISISRPDPANATNTIETGALSYGHHVSPDLTGGITFTSTGIASSGSYTSNTLTGGVTEGSGFEISSLTAQFYGDAAEEVAGTFNAYGLALSKQTDPSTALDDIANRGDVIGAFGAMRDKTMPADN